MLQCKILCVEACSPKIVDLQPKNRNLIQLYWVGTITTIFGVTSHNWCFIPNIAKIASPLQLNLDPKQSCGLLNEDSGNIFKLHSCRNTPGKEVLVLRCHNKCQNARKLMVRFPMHFIVSRKTMHFLKA